MIEKEISCLYGSGHTKDILYVYGNWYVIKGSKNVNKTYDDINDGVDVELLTDVDCFTCSKPLGINSLEELKAFINDE